MEPLQLTDVLYFTRPVAGRERNDANNKRREFILEQVFHKRCDVFVSDATHGAAWRDLQNALYLGLSKVYELEGIPSPSKVLFEHKGSRKYNFDFLLTIESDSGKKLVPLEFKFGGTSVDSLPEFFNPSADKPFHVQLYASYYYKNYLARVAEIYGLTEALPTEEQYMKYIHQNAAKIPFLKALDAAERADTDKSAGSKYQRKRVLVAESITNYLESVRGATNIENITSELQRSQNGKRFFIYNEGKVFIDSLKSTELEIESVVGLNPQKNTLVLQTKEPGTQVHMLLRWKNHLGVLFPAWQISLFRNGN